MSVFAVVGSKGEVTIPKEVRVRLGLKEGDRVELAFEGNHTVIRPVRAGKNPFEAYAGALGTFGGTAAEINDWVVEMRNPQNVPTSTKGVQK